MPAPREEVVPTPFRFVTAVLALCLLTPWAYLGATPRASAFPEREPTVRSVPCEELDGWIERVQQRGYSHTVYVLAGLRHRRRDHAVFLVCGERARQVHEPGGLESEPGGVRVRILADGRIVGGAVGSGATRPRAQAETRHQLGLFFGVLGWLFLVAAWATRPFDVLRDMFSRAPEGGHVLEPPGNDRLRVAVGDGPFVEMSERYLVPDREAGLVVGVARGAHVELPGAGASYRESAGGPPIVIGPATLNGLRVPSGARASLAHGDRLRFAGGPLLTIELPKPGRVLRYLVRDGALRGTYRARDGRAPARLAVPLVCGLAAAVAPNLDLPFRGLLVAVAGVLALLALLRLPAGLTGRVECHAPLDQAHTLRASRAGQDGLRIQLGHEPFARLPLAEDVRDPDLRRLLHCVDEELRWLTDGED